MSLFSLTGHALSADSDYPRLKDYLISNTGLAYYGDKDNQLAGHVAKRIELLGLPDCASYLQLLQADELDGSELDKLIATLTIGETFFFRHHEAFDALRDVVLPDLIRRNQGIRKLRIWSAGCSIGAEPYSIAILLKRDLAHLLSGWEVTLIATDINRDFLDRAREGTYEDWAFRSVPEEIKQTCFSHSGKSWTIDPHYKESISFQYHNLVKDPCPSLRNHLDGFDLILCRNVTIYFSQETVRNLVQELYFSLIDNGWLLVGHSEPNVDLYRSFRAVNLQGAVLYQKAAEPATSPAWGLPAPRPAIVPDAFTLPPVPVFPLARAPVFAPKHRAAEGRKIWSASAPATTDLTAIQAIADHGDLEKAVQACEKLLETEKLNPSLHFYYALVLEQMGRRRETQEALRRAIYLDRNFVIAHYYLGLIQQRLRQPRDAFRCFRNVLALLSGLKSEQPVPAADELTAGELEQLTRMHMNALPQTMSTERQRIDWDAAKQQLAGAESALEKALVADADRIDEAYRRRAVQMAKPQAGGAAGARTITVLVFALGAETYGLPINDLAEVLPSTRCTPVPRAAAEIAGVINLRGELRSVIDLRQLLTVPPAADESASCILMLRNGRGEVGLKVGQVEKVQTIREDELASPDIGGADGSGSYVKGLSPDKVIVLNPAALRLHPVFRNSP